MILFLLAFRIPYGHKQLIHYHVRCFTCSECSRQLHKGELYGLTTNTHTGLNIYCEQHYRQRQRQVRKTCDEQQTFNQFCCFSSLQSSKCSNQGIMSDVK